MSTSALVTPISEVRLGESYHLGGLPLELMRRAAELGGAYLDRDSGNYPVNNEVLKRAAQRLLVEAGVTLLYHLVLGLHRRGRSRHVQKRGAPGARDRRRGVARWLTWICRGNPAEMGIEQTIAEIPVTTFGNWLRVTVRSSTPDTSSRVLIHVNLKG